MAVPFKAPVGVALGSGAARGWSHIGVLRALEEAGIRPEVVCGSSSGAVVGAFYAAGELGVFERWIRSLEWREVMTYLDPTLRGGLLKARKLFEAMSRRLPDRQIEDLGIPFGAVATDLSTGQEVWLRKGPLHSALRASMALPGLITPERHDDAWLVDGGLVNPVPVSLCRAMGAATVIAVDLNASLLGRRLGGSAEAHHSEDGKTDGPAASDADHGEFDARPLSPTAARLLSSFQEFASDLLEQLGFDDAPEPSGPTLPSIYEVITNSINIMQVRIGRSRMSGDPPDMLVTPRLDDFALLDFNRAEEAIETGRRAVAQALAAR